MLCLFKIKVLKDMCVGTYRYTCDDKKNLAIDEHNIMIIYNAKLN